MPNPNTENHQPEFLLFYYPRADCCLVELDSLLVSIAQVMHAEAHCLS